MPAPRLVFNADSVIVLSPRTILRVRDNDNDNCWILVSDLDETNDCVYRGDR